MKPYLFYRENRLRTEKERRIYDNLRQGLKQCCDKIFLEDAAEEQIWPIFQYITLDNPVILVRGIRWQRSMNRDVYVFPSYPETAERHFAAIEETKRMLLDIIAQAKLPDNAFVKEQFIHDWLAQNIEYEKTSEKNIYTWYGAIRDRKAVCEGIAKTAKLMFDVVGVPSAVVSGKARSAPDSPLGPHAWNLVRLNGCWYHLDITFDNSWHARSISYDYYNLSDAAVCADHVVEVPLGVLCPDERMAWHYRNSVCAKDMEEMRKKLRNIFRNCVKSDKNITFKLPPVCDNGAAAERVRDMIREEMSQVSGYRRYSLRCNPIQMVFEICFG